MEYLLFQEFFPPRKQVVSACIWCGKTAPTNRAHIISKKLTANSPNSPVLQLCVCARCNSACGKLEQWILRYTPISLIRLMMYLDSNRDGTSKHTPSYFFSDHLAEWVVFYLEAATQQYAIPTQLIFPPTKDPFFLTQKNYSQHQTLLESLSSTISSGGYSVSTNTSLPEDFSPRFLLDDEKVILIGQNSNDVQKTRTTSLSFHGTISNRRFMRAGNSGNERHHLQWSTVNWIRFCAKSAFETLCLFAGASACMSATFSQIKRFVLHENINNGYEIVIKQMADFIKLHQTRCVDLSIAQNAPSVIPAFDLQCEPGMHCIILHEFSGWVIASVSLAGLPTLSLILGGPNIHLDDIYMMVYDDMNNLFSFLHLADDPTVPAIPLSVSGELFSSIADTYKLKRIIL